MPAIVNGDTYLALPRAAETWLVEPLIPAGGKCLIYGDPKVGKSYAALQLAASIRTGGDWLGFPIRTTGPVVYIQLDTPRSLWAERLGTLKEDGFPVGLLDFADRETLDTYPFDILDPTHATILRLALAQVKPVAVIVDTIREFHQGDEDKSTPMKMVVSTLASVCESAALIFVAHARKAFGDAGPDLLNDNRGSGYLVGVADSIIRFTEKSMYYAGRAIEKGSIRLHRTDNGLWITDTADSDAAVSRILADPTLSSNRARAKALSLLVGKSEEACRSLIRRHLLRGPGN